MMEKEKEIGKKKKNKDKVLKLTNNLIRTVKRLENEPLCNFEKHNHQNSAKFRINIKTTQSSKCSRQIFQFVHD